MARLMKNDLKTVSTICVLAAAITACGGGSSSGSDEDDSDAQGIFGSTVDTDNDGLTDTFEDTIGTNPNLFDTDGDGLDDGAEQDIHFTNPLEADSDGDGTSDFDEVNAGTDPTDSAVGGTFEGPAGNTDDTCDLDSANDSWADNCELQRFGPLADSSYVRGVQRILWCQNNNNEQAVDINTYADGEIGMATDESIKAYQTANPPLAVDGIVGPMTWTELRMNLQLEIATLIGFETYSIEGCGSEAQFYQQVETVINSDGDLVSELRGWNLAEFPGSTTLADFNSQF